MLDDTTVECHQVGTPHEPQLLGLTEQELLDDTAVECHQVGTPHEPLNFLEEAVAAGHPKA